MDKDETPRPPAPSSRPGRQTKSAREMQDRIEFVAFMLGQMIPEADIREAIRKKYHYPDGRGLGWQTCVTYIRRAKQWMMERLKRPPDDWVNESASFYLSICQSAASTVDQKLRAREDLDELLGTKAAARIIIEGNPERPLEHIFRLDDYVAGRIRSAEHRRLRAAEDEIIVEPRESPNGANGEQAANGEPPNGEPNGEPPPLNGDQGDAAK
jgi:hypothetical protein